MIARDWSSVMAKHGYKIVDKANESGADWKEIPAGVMRLLGRVAFWKEKYADGIIVDYLTVIPNSNKIMKKIEVAFAIGDALSYLISKDLDVLKGVHFEKTSNSIVSAIPVNNKMYPAQNIDFDELYKLSTINP